MFDCAAFAFTPLATLVIVEHPVLPVLPSLKAVSIPAFLAFSLSFHCESGIPSVNIVHIMLHANLMLSVALSFISISGKLRDSFKTLTFENR